MKDYFKNNLPTFFVAISTVVLGGVAIFTALRLYQLRSEPVTPSAPGVSEASLNENTLISCDTLTVQFATPTSSATATSTSTSAATATSTSTATATGTAT